MKIITAIERQWIETKFAAAGQPLQQPMPEFLLGENHNAIGIGEYVVENNPKLLVSFGECPCLSLRVIHTFGMN